MTGFGIVSSFLRRRVQPLKERGHLGLEYSGAEDSSRMVPALELTDEEVLERLQKMLKGVSVIPPAVPEYSANNPPPAVSCLSSFFFLFEFFMYSFCVHSCLVFPCLGVLSFFVGAWAELC